MDLKLKNNQNLTISTFPDSVKAKITTVYIQNCPQINALSLLNSIMSLQESVTPKLSRIRVDIGARAGSYSDLMKFSNLQGFDDDYNFQAKPRFVGSYYIDSWHTIEQLNNARSIFESADFTISHDSTKIINFNDLAVQTLDSTKPNYNPAVAIILQARGLGITMSEYPLGYGRWFLTKSQAAAITSFQQSSDNSYFRSVTTVTDSSAIVSDDATLTYDFEYFNELVYFTGFNQIYQYCFLNCTKLKEVDLSNHKLNTETFNGCTSLQKVVLNSDETIIPHKCFCNCSKLEVINLPNTITTISNEAFERCGKNKDLDLNLPNLTGSTGTHPFFGSQLIRKVINLGTLTTLVSYGFSRSSCTEVTLPATLTTMTGEIFAFCPNLVFVHLLSETPPSASSNCFNSTTTNYKIYVGDGSSAAHDDAILADYQAASGWSSYSSRLDTWYNYLHPTT